jgi:hypothetical protein
MIMGEIRNIGIIVSTTFDRDGNDLVIRGTLKLFGKSIAELTYENLQTLNLDDIYVYTNLRGVALKNIFGKKVKYIISKSKCLYSNTATKNEFIEYVKDADNIILMDPKYPFLNSSILNNLFIQHQNELNDITFIKCEYEDNTFIPNIAIMKLDAFITLFNKTDFLKQSFDLNSIIMNKTINLKIGCSKISSLYQIMPLSNGKIINNIEKMLKNRK